MKVLIIEDERSMALEVEYFLLNNGYLCELAFNAKQARAHMRESGFDFILLDLGLPDEDGLSLLASVKNSCPQAAYIILTARGQVEDRIKGLNLGADDYLPKPFSLPELQSRMQAISRRKSGLTDNIVALGEFTVNMNSRTIAYKDDEVALSKKEFDLVNYLLVNKNRALSRLQLSEHIWGGFADDDYDSNFIDVHIKNIRRKLSVFGSVEWLQTIRGVGYKIKL
jgi:two-component system, OmpR family, response regulator